jgi:general secretion pathway protein G
MQKRFITDCRGFSLIELMVVIVILGILAGMVVPKFMGRTDDAKIIKAKVDIAALTTALKLYKLDNGDYPTTEQGLKALIEPPDKEGGSGNWKKGGYLDKKTVPKDPWNNDFIYLCPGTHDDFDIISYGADGVPGGEDKNKDIKSWEIE